MVNGLEAATGSQEGFQEEDVIRVSIFLSSLMWLWRPTGRQEWKGHGSASGPGGSARPHPEPWSVEPTGRGGGLGVEEKERCRE